MALFQNRFGTKIVPTVLASCVALASVLTLPVRAAAGGGGAAAMRTVGMMMMASSSHRAASDQPASNEPPISGYEQELLRTADAKAILASAPEAQTNADKLAFLQKHNDALPAQMIDHGAYNEISLQGGKIKMLYFKEEQHLTPNGPALLNVPVLQGVSLNGQSLAQHVTLEAGKGTFILFAHETTFKGWFGGRTHEEVIHVLSPEKKRQIFVLSTNGKNRATLNTNWRYFEGGYGAYVYKALDAAAAKDPSLVGMLCALHQVLQPGTHMENPTHPQVVAHPAAATEEIK